MGVWARGAGKNLGPATVEANNFKFLFLQPLKLATSNLVYNLGLGISLPRNNFYDQNWQASGLGEHPKNLGPPIFSATVEATNFKFSIKVGIGE